MIAWLRCVWEADCWQKATARPKVVEAPQEVPALEPVHMGTPANQQQQQQVAAQNRSAQARSRTEPTLSPDEFESALNAARTMMRKGDFEGAEYLFSQCNALLDHHEGEGLHTAYLVVDWAPCLNQLKRFDEANAMCERASRILEEPQFQEHYEELAQVKIPLFHASAIACVGLHRFAEGRDLIDSCLDLIGKADPYKAFMLLVKCDLLEKEAESIEKDSGKAASFDEVLQTALQAAREARDILDQNAAEFAAHPIYFKPDTSMVSIFLTWGRMDEAEDMQEQLIKKMALSGQVPVQRLAFQTDEFADICLDSGKMAKAERLYLDALKIWEGVPGVVGMANANKARCELAHKIYFCQVGIVRLFLKRDALTLTVFLFSHSRIRLTERMSCSSKRARLPRNTCWRRPRVRTWRFACKKRILSTLACIRRAEWRHSLLFKCG